MLEIVDCRCCLLLLDIGRGIKSLLLFGSSLLLFGSVCGSFWLSAHVMSAWAHPEASVELPWIAAFCLHDLK